MVIKTHKAFLWSYNDTILKYFILHPKVILLFSDKYINRGDFMFQKLMNFFKKSTDSHQVVLSQTPISLLKRPHQASIKMKKPLTSNQSKFLYQVKEVISKGEFQIITNRFESDHIAIDLKINSQLIQISFLPKYNEYCVANVETVINGQNIKLPSVSSHKLSSFLRRVVRYEINKKLNSILTLKTEKFKGQKLVIL